VKNACDESIKSDCLSELVLLKIQELIINKEFREGNYLPSEKDLVERFGVGKSSVREAIKMLQVLGAVQSKQGKGTCISDNLSSNVLTSLQFSLMLQQNTPEELSEFRTMYEAAFMEMAAGKATEEDKNRIRKLYIQLADKFYEGSLTVDDDLEFHKAILEITRNPFIVKIGNMIFEMLKPAYENSNYYSKEKALTDHSSIMEAFLGEHPGNINKAAGRMRNTSHKKKIGI
jgi:DNA-binding FadR family transcriptional regulator